MPDYSVVSFCHRSEDDKVHAITRPYEDKDPPTVAANTPFFDDLYRILNCEQWRRLDGIYQFVPNRRRSVNRITHSMDVQNVGELIARALELDDNSRDLVRAIAAIHDIGHMPYGHDGERAAVAMLSKFGKSWNHDAAGLRIVTEWANYNGLNLTLDTLEGLTKRYWRFNDARHDELERLDKDDPRRNELHYVHHTKELPASILKINEQPGHSLYLDKWNHIEGQIAAVSDWISFTATDIEEGLCLRWMPLHELCKNFPLAAEAYSEVTGHFLSHINIDEEEHNAKLWKKVAETVKTKLLDDVITTARKNIEREVTAGHLQTADDVRNCGLLVTFSPEVLKQMHDFGEYCKEYPFQRAIKAHGSLEELVRMTIEDVVAGKIALPPDWQRNFDAIKKSANGDDQARMARLTEFACTYMTCVMTDGDVKAHVKHQHPDFWLERKRKHRSVPRISPAGIREDNGESAGEGRS